MRWLLTILTLLVTSTVFGQGFTYSYVDPCSKKLKTIYLSSNESVTVNYLGVIGTFSQTDFQNGVFSSWIQTAQSQAASQPCDELKTQTQTNQNIFLTQNIISTLTSITAASTMNIASGNMMSNALGNSTSNSSETKSSSPRSRKNSERNGNQENSSGNQTNTTPGPIGGPRAGQGGTNQNSQNQNTGAGGENQPQGGVGSNTNTAPQTGGQPSQPSVTPGSSSSGNTGQSSNTPSTGSGSSNTTQPGSGSSSGSSGSSTGSSSGSSSGGDNSGSTGSNSGGNGGGQGTSSNSGSQGQSQGQNVQEGQTPPKTSTDQGQSGNGGTTNSIANAAEASSSSGSGSGGSKVRVGSIVGTGDIVAIRSAEDNSNQFKGTMSVTKSNTNNTKAKGFLLNFTTTINNSNLTFYTAFSNKAKTNTLILANSSMLDFDANFFNTTTALESRRFGRVTLMAGANFTVGKMADENFNNLSGVGGGFYPFKLGKKISGNTLLLAVYSPYTKFYEGKWWDSGILLVPFSSWDYTISKSFKYNVSFSGTYQMKGSVLQYQILTGGKILL